MPKADKPVLRLLLSQIVIRLRTDGRRTLFRNVDFPVGVFLYHPYRGFDFVWFGYHWLQICQSFGLKN